MNHLKEMCCNSCREKLEAIEARSLKNFDLFSQEQLAQLVEDRSDLLIMVEQLLSSVTIERQKIHSLYILLEVSRAAALRQEGQAS